MAYTDWDVVMVMLSITFLLFAGLSRAEAVKGLNVYDFETGDLSGFRCQGQEQTVQGDIVRAGNYAMRSVLTYNRGEPRRSEVIPVTQRGDRGYQGQDPARFEIGEEYWIGFSIYLPDYWEVDPNQGDTLFQIHDAGKAGVAFVNTTPALAIRTETDGRWRVIQRSGFIGERGQEVRGPEINSYFGSYMADRGRWSDFAIHWRTSPRDDGNGYLKVWKDGVVVHENNRANIYEQGDCPGHYLKIGIYKPSWSRPDPNPVVTKRVVYHDELRIGVAGAGYTGGYAGVMPE